ncbi:MAG: DUF6541 family protein [Solirubrobacterales bacterium]
MRVDIAQFAVTVLYVVPGILLLTAVRVIELRAIEIAAALGLAYLVGVAMVTTSSILLLVLSVPMSAPIYLVVALLLSVGCAVGIRRVKRGENPSSERRPASSKPSLLRLRGWLSERSTAWWVAALTVSVIALFAVVGFITALKAPVSGWDGWSIWARKGQMLFYEDALPKEFFTSENYRFMHPDYPLLIPVWESVFFRFAGAPNTQALHGQFWILLVAGLWAAGFLAHRAVPAIRGSKEWAAAIWAPLLGVLIVTPGIHRQTLQIYADIPMAVFAMGAALCIALWLQGRRSGYLVVAALLLGATANVKNEGLTTALAVIGAMLIVRLFAVEGSRWKSFKPAAICAAAVAALAVLPWRIWLTLNDVHGLVSITDGVSPDYIWEHRERVHPSVGSVVNQLVQPGVWNFIPTLAVAIVLACLIVGVARRIATFYGLAGVLTLAAIVWGYVVAPTELGSHLGSSSDRLVDGFAFISAAAVLHLTILLAKSGAEDSALEGAASGSASGAASGAANAAPAHD